MKEEEHIPKLSDSHLDHPSAYNNQQSIQINNFQQDLTKQQLHYDGAYAGELIVSDQYSSIEQAYYQSLDYGQKIAFSHNILKDLLHMLDHKFPTIHTTSPLNTPPNIQKPNHFRNPTHVQSNTPKSNQKLEEKMLQVRDKLSQIITFINKEIDGMTSPAVKKSISLAQFKEQLFQVRAAISVLPTNQKELIDINQQQYQTKQQSTIKQPKIVIDKNRLRNAKEVFSQQLLSFHQLEQTIQPTDLMGSSLDRISEGINGETVQVKSNRISEINHNVSQVKSEQPKTGVPLNFHEENLSQLDETGKIILTTINKKTISTTTIPKNHHKTQYKKPIDDDKDASQINGKQIRKNKFWKQKQNSNHNKESVIQKQRQVQNKNSEKQIQISKTQQNRHSHQFTFNNSKVFHRNLSLNDLRRGPNETNFQSLPNFRIKSNFDEHPTNISQMKQPNIIPQFGRIHTTSNQQQQRKRPQQNNPETITQKIHPRMIINHPLPSKVQQKYQSRLNLIPQPSNRPHSLPNHISRNILTSSNMSPQVLSPLSRVIINPRPNLNSSSLMSVNNSIYVGQKHSELSKNSIINRKIVFPQTKHLINVSQNNYVPPQLSNFQQYPHRVSPTLNNTISIKNQPYQQLQHSKKPQFISKFRPANAHHLQKIIELSEQSIQTSFKKDTRSELSLQTSGFNLYQSNASSSTIMMNGKTLKKRGIQITSKQHINVNLMQ